MKHRMTMLIGLLFFSVVVFAQTSGNRPVQWCFELDAQMIKQNFNTNWELRTPATHGVPFDVLVVDDTTSAITGATRYYINESATGFPGLTYLYVNMTGTINPARTTALPNDAIFRAVVLGNTYTQGITNEDGTTPRSYSFVIQGDDYLTGAGIAIDYDHNAGEQLYIRSMSIEGWGTPPFPTWEGSCVDFTPEATWTLPPTPTAIPLQPTSTPTNTPTPTATLTALPTSTPFPSCIDIDFTASSSGDWWATSIANSWGSYSPGVGFVQTTQFRSSTGVWQHLMWLDVEFDPAFGDVDYLAFNGYSQYSLGIDCYQSSCSVFGLRNYTVFNTTFTGTGSSYTSIPAGSWSFTVDAPSNTSAGGAFISSLTNSVQNTTFYIDSMTVCFNNPIPTATATSTTPPTSTPDPTDVAGTQQAELDLTLTATALSATPSNTPEPTNTEDPGQTWTPSPQPSYTPQPTYTTLPTYTPYPTSEGGGGGENPTGNLDDVIGNLPGIGDAIGDALDGFNDAMNDANEGLGIARGIADAWMNAPAIPPPMMPNCSTEPLENEICALWYILENTLFSGIGQIYVPIILFMIDMLILIRIVVMAVLAIKQVREWISE